LCTSNTAAIPLPTDGDTMKILETAYETFTLEEAAPGIAAMTLNRPETYNAMNNTMFEEFEKLAWAIDDDDDVRVLIMTGAGKAFCSGYDLKDADDLPNLGAMGMLDQQARAARSLLALRSIRIPFIAAVNG